MNKNAHRLTLAERNLTLYHDEVVIFLQTCEKINLKTTNEIATGLTDIADKLIDCHCQDCAQLKQNLQLLKAMLFLVKGALYEEL